MPTRPSTAAKPPMPARPSTPVKPSTVPQPLALPTGKKTPPRPARPPRLVPTLNPEVAEKPAPVVDIEQAQSVDTLPSAEAKPLDLPPAAANAPLAIDSDADEAAEPVGGSQAAAQLPGDIEPRPAVEQADDEKAKPAVSPGDRVAFKPAHPSTVVGTRPAIDRKPAATSPSIAETAATSTVRTPPVHTAWTPAAATASNATSRGWVATAVSLVPVLALVVLLTVCGAVALSGLTTPASTEAATTDAASDWLIHNVDNDQRLIVDSAMTADLQAAGWDGDDALWSLPAGARATESDAPASWRDADYVVTTATVRDDAGALPQVAAAIVNSTPVATFGSGDRAVEVRKVTPEGAVLASAADAQAAATRTAHGAELAQNPGIRLSDADRELLTDGRVDARIISVLGALAAEGDVIVTGFPVLDGEQGRPLRQVAISAVGDQPLVADGERTPQASGLIDGLVGRFAADDVVVRDDNLILRYSPSVDAFLD